MCGIIGYYGNDDDFLKKGILAIKNLEYRGYDSAGIALVNNKDFYLKKTIGDIKQLEIELDYNKKGNLFLAHSRWATTGSVSSKNAHPHFDCKQNYFVVHNGIIENYLELKQQLLDCGHNFISETDTEVIAHLIEEFEPNMFFTNELPRHVKGSYALGIIDNKNKILYGFKYKSPLVVGKISDEEYILASDANAILFLTNKIIYLEDGDWITINKSLKIYNVFQKKWVTENRNWIELKNIEQENYDNFETVMQKEIYDQYHVLNQLKNIDYSFDIKKYNKVNVIACGTAFNAGLVAKVWFEKYLKVDTDVILASEFQYKCNNIDKRTLCLFISQSGETADTCQSAELVKNKCDTIAICNVYNSTLTRLVNKTFYIYAGFEKAVASTKAFTAQLYVLSKLVNLNLDLQLKLNTIKKYENEIKDLILQLDLSKIKNIFIIGRGINVPISYEGALKTKELSYIHAEGLAAGELKHGSLALIDSNFLTIALESKGILNEKMISNINEIKARGGQVIELKIEEEIYDENILIFYLTIKLQLIAYYLAKKLNRNIDKPRNLAKSVTVE